MTHEHDESQAFAQRAGSLLRAGAEQVDEPTRARLAKARANAVAAARTGTVVPFRYLAPAGALASAAAVAMLLMGRGPGPIEIQPGTATLGDLELLADADALELAEESDLDFIEWAAAMAELEGSDG